LPSNDAALAAVCEHGITSFIENLRQIVESEQPAVDKVRAVIANQLSPLRKDPDGDYVRVFLRHRHELITMQPLLGMQCRRDTAILHRRSARKA